jgi:hypothetical protein
MGTHERVKLGDEQFVAIEVLQRPPKEFLGPFGSTRMHYVHMRSLASKIAKHLLLDPFESPAGRPWPRYRPDFPD